MIFRADPAVCRRRFLATQWGRVLGVASLASPMRRLRDPGWITTMSVGRTNQGPSSNILVLLQAFIDDCRLYSESIYEDVEQGDDSP